MKRTTEKRITSLDQLKENDKICLVHNVTGTRLEFTVSKIDHSNNKITLTRENTTKTPDGMFLESKNSLTLYANPDDYIFSDAMTVLLVEDGCDKAKEPVEKIQKDTNECGHKEDEPSAPLPKFDKKAPVGHTSETSVAINPFTGELERMPVLVIDDPDVLPFDFERPYCLQFSVAWGKSIEKGLSDNSALYPILFRGRVFGVTATDRLNTVIVRVSIGPDQPIFEAVQKSKPGKHWDVNTAISACVIKLISAIGFWGVMTTAIAFSNKDLLAMFDGDSISDVLDSIDDIGQDIVKKGLEKHLKVNQFGELDEQFKSSDSEDEVENDDDDDGDESSLSASKPWWWRTNEFLL